MTSTQTKTKKMERNDIYAKLGRHHSKLLRHLRAMLDAGRSEEDVSRSLERYYQVTSPRVYEALQTYPTMRGKNLQDVFERGIELHLKDEEYDTLNLDSILFVVKSITRDSGA